MKSSDGIQRVSFGRDVPSVINDLVLTPAGSRRDDAIVPALIGSKEASHDIREVVWDRGYSQLAAEATTHPLRKAGIDTVFRPRGPHQRLVTPLDADSVLIDGLPYSAHLPEDLRD